MPYQEWDENMVEITKGSVLTVKDGFLSIREIQDSTGLSDGDRLLLVASESRIIRLFPITKDEVWFMRINLDLDKFHSVVKNIHKKLREFELVIVYTSGVCTVRSNCFLEVYFETDNKEQIIMYSKWLETQDAVINVETEQLDVRR